VLIANAELISWKVMKTTEQMYPPQPQRLVGMISMTGQYSYCEPPFALPLPGAHQRRESALTSWHSALSGSRLLPCC